MKRAVIDIDNTLWHFCDVLYERLKKINEAMHPPDYWIECVECYFFVISLISLQVLSGLNFFMAFARFTVFLPRFFS